MKQAIPSRLRRPVERGDRIVEAAPKRDCPKPTPTPTPSPSPTPVPTPTPCVPSDVWARVLLLVGDGELADGDLAVQRRLSDLHYEVKVMADHDATVADAGDRDLVLISSSVDSSEVDRAFRDASLPVITWEPQLYDDLALSRHAGRLSSSDDRLKIADRDHALAASLQGVPRIALSKTRLSLGRPTKDAIRVARAGAGHDDYALFAYERGAQMAGLSAPARRVALFLGEETASHLNTDGWRLFDASVKWALSKEALFIVGPPSLSKGDLAQLYFLERLGYALTVRMDEKARVVDALDKDFVYLSATVRPGDLRPQFRDVAVPLIVSEPKLFDDLSLTGAERDVDYGETLHQSTMRILDSNHPLAAGLKGDVRVALEPSSFGWGRPSSEAFRVAETSSGSGEIAVFAYETGASMVGRIAPERRVALFPARGAAAHLSSDGWALVRAAVAWATRSRDWSCTRGMDVMQAIDRSGSMRGDSLKDAKRAARRFISSMHLDRERIGLVSFSTQASLDHPLTHDGDAVAAAIQGLEAGGSTDIGAGLALAHQELLATGRDDDVMPVVILLTDGKNTHGDPFAPAEAAKAAGVRIIAIGLGQHADESDLRRIVSSSIDYYYAPSSADLGWIYALIAGILCEQDNRQPEVDAGPDQTISLPTNEVTLSGVVSDDGLPECAPLTILWSKVSGPGAVVFADPSAAVTTATFSAAGEYVLRLTADDTEKQGSDEIVVHVLGENEPPVVDAGPDQKAVWPTVVVTLTGTVVDDGLPAGGMLTTEWTVATQECVGKVLIADPSSPVTTATINLPGPCVLRLTASDSELEASDETIVTLIADNTPPVVDAGPDQTVVWPTNAVTLAGTIVDDGLPIGGALTSAWSVVTPECANVVAIGDAAALTTTATFTKPAACDLKLSASDSEFSGSDTVTIVVAPPPFPDLTAEGASLNEGHEQTTAAIVRLLLSRASDAPVSLDFVTQSGSADESCDFIPRAGTVVFAPGETEKTIAIPIVGDVAVESDGELTVEIGNLEGAWINGAAPGPEDRIEARIAIINDDSPNQPPAAPALLTPANGAVGVNPNPMLTWTGGSDPDMDAVGYDVRFGTELALGSQAWRKLCPATQAPFARGASASAYDDANDRLIVFGGRTSEADTDEVWVLENATGNAGAPSWTLLSTSAGPGPRHRAAAAYDPVTNRFTVHGGCQGACDSALSDTWVLTNANGLGGAPEWIALPDAPVARSGHAAALDAAGNRLIVFGGEDGPAKLNDVWVLDGASGVVTPAWRKLEAAGAPPSPRADASAVFDPDTKRLIVFGGFSQNGAPQNDAWILQGASGADAAQWMQATASGTPPTPRSGHAAAFDVSAQRMVVFGGLAANATTGARWALNDSWLLTEALQWQKLSIADRPAGRVLPAAGYSAARDRLVVALGFDEEGRSRHDDVWSLSSPIGALPLVSPNQSESTFLANTPSDAATYFWSVVARDEHGATTVSPVWRFWLNSPPVVDAGTDVTLVGPQAIPLQGTASDDGLPSAAALSIKWSQLEGPSEVAFDDPSEARTTAVFDETGAYVLRLTADDSVASRSDELVVVVKPANHAPEVNAGEDVDLVPPTNTTTLAGAATDDGLPSGSALTTEWSQVSGPAEASIWDPSSLVTTAVFSVSGSYRLRLTASDDELSASDDIVVTAQPVNQPPQVNAGLDHVTALPLATVTLDGSVSDDGLPSGVVNVTWSQVSGPAPVNMATPGAEDTQATFTQDGTYVLRLSADDSELSASDDVSITVLPPQDLPDLVIHSVDASSVIYHAQTLAISGELSVQIANIGSGAVLDSFEIAFFEDQNANGIYETSDNLLGTAGPFTQALLSGGSAVVTAPVVGSVLFPGSLIYAFVDSGHVIDESAEANNYASSAPRCEPWTGTRPFNTQLEWGWITGAQNPTSANVLSTPMVADLDLDGTPEVVMVSYLGNYFNDGVLRVLDGRTGAEKFSVDDEMYHLAAIAHLAVGDIDLDGHPEIIGVHESRTQLVAFEHDGTPKWISDTIEYTVGAIALANLVGDARPEIITGRQVLDADGRLLWTGASAAGTCTQSSTYLSVVADVNLDGAPDVVAGNTIYSATGEILLRDVSVSNRTPAVADFDDDPFPEIILACGGVQLVKPDFATGRLTTLWGPVNLPGGGGGPAAVADVDGDGRPEVAVAGVDYLMVLEHDGTVKWTAQTHDFTSGISAPSAFDFDGDGQSEIVYADEERVLVFRGIDGAILFETPHTSVSWLESPAIADVDADGRAEIIVGATGTKAGVFVFGNTQGYEWMGSRGIWNQHSYHVTNVNDDGTIPEQESPRWDSQNSCRENVLTSGCPTGLPDLVPAYLRAELFADKWRLTARVGNGGSVHAPAGVSVSFHDGDPRWSGRPLGITLTTASIAPGRFEDVTVSLPAIEVTTYSIWVSVDQFGSGAGAVLESIENNNVLDSGVALTSGGILPDIAVRHAAANVVTDRQNTVSGSVSAEIASQGPVRIVDPFRVIAFEDRDHDDSYDAATDGLLGSVVLAGLGHNETKIIEIDVSGTLDFRDRPIHVFADSDHEVVEAAEDNNIARTGATCAHRPVSTSFELDLEWSWVSSPNDPESRFVLMTPSVVDLNLDGVPDVVFVTTDRPSSTYDGRLRAIDGRDGTELLSVTDASLELRPSGDVAVGNLDEDPYPEIVAVHDSMTRVIAFEHDGTVKWITPSVAGGTALGIPKPTPMIVNLDDDPLPEVVVGRTAIDHDGSLLWSHTCDSYGVGTISAVADLNLDGTPEVVAGGTVYAADGTVLWETGIRAEGYVAVGNFDTDAYPEIVYVFGVDVYMFEHSGALKWGPSKLIRTAGYDGPPALADFDGDGILEIGVAGYGHCAVVDGSGALKWIVPITESIGMLGLSAFDFDGNGIAEILVADEEALRILRGQDGLTLAAVPVAGRKRHSYPLAVDVDGDGATEIVVAGGDELSAPYIGIQVFGESKNQWVSTRRIWNQHSYHVTNVNDDATIPFREIPSWTAGWGYRQSALLQGSPFMSPDLTASGVRSVEAVESLTLIARIGNGGAARAGSGVPVSFYDGDPRNSGALLGTVHTVTNLDPGDFEDVALALPGDSASTDAIWAVADDDGSLEGIYSECDEFNNFADSSVHLNQPPVVDAGPDQAIMAPEASVTLRGSATDDGLPVGGSLSYVWSVVAAPAPESATFGDPSAPHTTVTLSEVGTYVLRLTASDSALTGNDDVEVLRAETNTAPTVDAGADQSHAGDMVLLMGTVDDDGLPTGASLTVAWTKVSGGGRVYFADPSAPQTAATFSEPGVYVLELSASDTELTETDQVQIEITAPLVNRPPLVNAGPDRILALPEATAILDGTVSDDGLPEGVTVQLEWRHVGGQDGPVVISDPNSEDTTVAFESPGSYFFVLVADDSEYAVSDSVRVTVTLPNEPPMVQAGPDLTITRPPTDCVTLQGVVTDDGVPGASTEVLWTQTGGPAGSAFIEAPNSLATRVAFAQSGVYVLRLTASDTWAMSWDEIAVTVEQGNLAPTVDAGPDQTLTWPTSSATLTGNATDDGLPTGSTLSFAWSLENGAVPVIFAAPDHAQTMVTFPQPGQYLLRLTASDSEHAAWDELIVTVKGTDPVGDPPAVQILHPEDGATVTSPSNVIGSVASDTLLFWTLERRARGESVWSRIASGSDLVTESALGVLDPTLLLNGQHEIRLTATDTAGRFGRI
ncbi:MAG: VCBS repeat-containing protein, partial [Vicinamibacteria bacterium]|nr:VCBS repeat-containing protein [Vicinamibacteria bacterium]